MPLPLINSSILPPGADDRVMDMAEFDQLAGCLIGTCVGDSLGYVIEGQTPEQCALYVDKRIRGGDLEGWSGQYSDDSQFTRELMQSIVACGTFNPTDYARRICALFVEDRIIGPGMGAIAAARLLAEGVPWYDAGTPAPSAGNGTAMRVAPLGVFYAKDHAALLSSAREQALITHLDPRCSAGAVAIAGAAALASDNPTEDPAAFVPFLQEWCRDDDPILADAITCLPEWRSMPHEWVRGTVKKIGDVPEHWGHKQGIPPFVTQSVLWSLYAFFCYPGDYVEAVSTAISGGGDVDTTAAMTGALCGARMGLSAIPDRWAIRVQDNETWGYKDLCTLAQACHSAHPDQSAGNSVSHPL